MVLLGIVWNAFCNAFARGIGLDLNSAIVLMMLLPLVQLGSLAALFSIFRSRLLLDVTHGEVVAATFCSGHKTLAFGLPLINMIFEGSPNLTSYCAPIMLTHPLQLVIGSLMSPYFTKFTTEEKDRMLDGAMTVRLD
jgi:sodium/bile acid cotransporter 7